MHAYRCQSWARAFQYTNSAYPRTRAEEVGGLIIHHGLIIRAIRYLHTYVHALRHTNVASFPGFEVKPGNEARYTKLMLALVPCLLMRFRYQVVICLIYPVCGCAHVCVGCWTNWTLLHNTHKTKAFPVCGCARVCVACWTEVDSKSIDTKVQLHSHYSTTNYSGYPVFSAFWLHTMRAKRRGALCGPNVYMMVH